MYISHTHRLPVLAVQACKGCCNSSQGSTWGCLLTVLQVAKLQPVVAHLCPQLCTRVLVRTPHLLVPAEAMIDSVCWACRPKQDPGTPAETETALATAEASPLLSLRCNFRRLLHTCALGIAHFASGSRGTDRQYVCWACRPMQDPVTPAEIEAALPLLKRVPCSLHYSSLKLQAFVAHLCLWASIFIRCSKGTNQCAGLAGLKRRQ